VRSLPGPAAAPIALYERLSTRTWLAVPHPPGRDLINGPGYDPDRVLLLGGSSAVGWGVLDHDLGLAGHLARQVSHTTGRGIDVQVVASPNLTVLRALAELNPDLLARCDAVVLAIGTREAFELMSVRVWRARLSRVLEAIAAAPGHPATVIVGAEELSPVPVPRWVARIAMARARALNHATRAVVDGRDGTTVVASGLVPDGEPAAYGLYDVDKARLYDRAARAIAPALSAALDGRPQRSESVTDERGRLEATARARAADERQREELDRLVAAARDLVGAVDAALVLVEQHEVTPLVTGAATHHSVPREHSLAGVAIGFRGGLIIPDLSLDERFRSRSDVTGSPRYRAYAGVPVRSPSGHSVAVLAVVDIRPREFAPQELALLREFASRAADVLFPVAARPEP
jgi:hypothetical protein